MIYLSRNNRRLQWVEDILNANTKKEDGLLLSSVKHSSKRKREPVYCQAVSTPAQTKRVLPFSTSELPSSSRGRPSGNDSVKATWVYYAKDGLLLPSVNHSSERKRKPMYCQVVATPAPTKRVLPFLSSELPSSSRGRPSR